MSREPRVQFNNGGAASRSGAFYSKDVAEQRGTSSSSVVAAAAAASGVVGGAAMRQPPPQQQQAQGEASADYPYVDGHSVQRLPRRIKPLPPDRNEAAVGALQLLQFERHVRFRCVRCKKDRIIADCLAVDNHAHHLMCVRCFTRVIRPKQFRPTRVVPFPSLLSWLNYTPQEVRSEEAVLAEDVTTRAADIVAPTGHRVQTLADAGSSLQTITDSAMNHSLAAERRGGGGGGGRGGLTGAVAAGGGKGVALSGAKHPCLRVWGACVHGDAMCMFAAAPANLCIAFLMGLCANESGECPLTHQHVLDLPDSISTDLPPPPRYANPSHPDAGKFAEWLARRTHSRNRAEWQLYNNGPLEGILNQYLPPPIADAPVAPPPPLAPSDGQPVAAISASSISGVLGRLRKKKQQPADESGDAPAAGEETHHLP